MGPPDDHDGAIGANLVGFPRAGSTDPAILSPTIERMLVDERQDRLVLHGGFGDQMGVATIDGSTVSVIEWTKSKVTLSLPRDGKGSCGPVQLTVGFVGNSTQLM